MLQKTGFFKKRFSNVASKYATNATFGAVSEGLVQSQYSMHNALCIEKKGDIKMLTFKKAVPNETVELFCLNLFACGSPIEASRRTGIEESVGIKLSTTRRVQRRLAKYYKSRELTLYRARAGLERLAFGRINDAAELALSGEETEFSRFDGADLFNVSELKRVKGGGVEIKFFDRLKAIEQLIALEELIRGNDSSDDFIRAFEQAVSEDGEQEDE